MFEWLDSLREKLSGRKTNIMFGVMALVAVVQFLVGIDLEVPALPPAENVGELAQQLWIAATGIFTRQAIAKVGTNING